MKKTIFMITALLIIAALSLAACGGSDEEPPASDQRGDAAAGERLFVATCSACHGPKGQGIQGLGKDMTTSEFIAGKTDDELVEFIKVGRGADDPLNTTGVAMLPKGGNPALTDDDLYDIVAYIRTLQKK
jgi:disulfide bond formation protein DsbB